MKYSNEIYLANCTQQFLVYSTDYKWNILPVNAEIMGWHLPETFQHVKAEPKFFKFGRNRMQTTANVREDNSVNHWWSNQIASRMLTLKWTWLARFCV